MYTIHMTRAYNIFGAYEFLFRVERFEISHVFIIFCLATALCQQEHHLRQQVNAVDVRWDA